MEVLILGIWALFATANKGEQRKHRATLTVKCTDPLDPLACKTRVFRDFEQGSKWAESEKARRPKHHTVQIIVDLKVKDSVPRTAFVADPTD